ncbi:MAG TPA: hypothetical protein VGD62_06650 [Acidobacteriaceae bacterium]
MRNHPLSSAKRPLTLLLLLLLARLPLAAQQQGEPGGPVHVPATRSNAAAAVERRRWSGIVEPGERVPELTVKDKFLFPLHETLRPVALLPMAVSGGWGVLENTDPKYGTNSEGFGERVGAAALRQASTRFFSDGLLPVLFHEDPRYYRKAYGSYRERGYYAIERVAVDQRDSGGRGINFADILGRGMAAALTQTYYPERSINGSVVLRTWGVSLAGDAGVNLFQEFWPDIKRKVFTRH